MGLLDTLYSECQGFLDLRAIKDGKTKQRFVGVHEHEQIKLFMKLYGKDHDLYFGVATRDGKAGKKENIVEIPALFIDVDFKTISGGQDAALERIEAFRLPPTAKVVSGGGVHLYWVLKEPADRGDIEQVEAIQRGLARMLDGDMAATDASRILRIPNTKNLKYKPARSVILAYCNGSRYNLSDFDDYLTKDSEPAPTAIKTDALDLIMDCYFMRHCRDDAAELKEPDWYAMATILAREPGGMALIHELSKPYPKYKKAATDQKILHALNSSGPMTCDKIREKTGFSCGRDCHVKSPASLKFLTATSATSATSKTNATRCDQDATRMRPGNEPRNVMQEVKDWLETCDGTFTIKDLAAEFRAPVASSLYNTIKDILFRLIKNNTIERVGSVRGVYRVVENQLTAQQWWEVSNEESPLTLPLSLGDLVKLMPKSIIVVAGEHNSSKSAFALNIAKENCNSYRTHYFNSEMSDEELRERIMRFDDVQPDHFRKVNFYPRTDNFQDVIFPDDLNIIDFLEIHDDFWRIGGILRAIYDKLNQGICVVNLQKAPGKDWGRGGTMSIEKARLYLAVSTLFDSQGKPFNRCKIVKAKLYRNFERNPNGMVRDFRVYGGAKLLSLSDWDYPRK